MDVSHIVVGGFTGVAIAWMIWAEIRSRRNSTAQEKNLVQAALAENEVPPTKSHEQSRKNLRRTAAPREISRRSSLQP